MSQEELGDSVALRNSSAAGGALVAVAQKANVDVCWVCFRPVLAHHVDVPMKSAWVRICTNQACADQCARELEGKIAVVGQSDESPQERP